MANKGTFGKVLTKSLGIQKRVHSTFVTDIQAVSTQEKASLWVISDEFCRCLLILCLYAVYTLPNSSLLPFVNYQYSCLYIWLKFENRLTLSVRKIKRWFGRGFFGEAESAPAINEMPRSQINLKSAIDYKSISIFNRMHWDQCWQPKNNSWHQSKNPKN